MSEPDEQSPDEHAPRQEAKQPDEQSPAEHAPHQRRVHAPPPGGPPRSGGRGDGHRGRVLWRIALALPAAAMLAVLVVPLAALLVTAGGSFIEGLRHPLVGPALKLSLATSGASLLVSVALGTPLAWLLARPGRAARLARGVEALVQLPMVVPPAVAGVALLLTFGRLGMFGAWLAEAGLQVAFTSAAVVLAQTFVAAPFYVLAATEAFRAVDERLLTAARGLGASPARAFVRVALPLALPGLFTGAAMCWARALGEFGATLMFAGNLPGRTQTLPLAIYTALEVDLAAARSLSIVLVVVAFTLLLAMRGLRPSRGDRRRRRATGSRGTATRP